MSKPQRLFCRGGRWTFRAYVPEELRPIIGKREIWKSLGTISHREVSAVSALEPVQGFSGREDFWIIAAIQEGR
jgi:hypothetical protein